MHASKTTSPRQTRLLKILHHFRRRRALTTLELIEMAQVCAVSTAISELRHRGYEISCHRVGDRWLYRLLRAPTDQPTHTRTKR